jgi:hypothetical protein
MSLLKQIFTGSNSATLLPTVEPTGAAYLKWKAKYHGSKLGATARANAIERYGEKAMTWYRKILKKEGKFPIS